eukprot:7653360-Pyramimonas_sp.AAC.1
MVVVVVVVVVMVVVMMMMTVVVLMMIMMMMTIRFPTSGPSNTQSEHSRMQSRVRRREHPMISYCPAWARHPWVLHRE